MKIEKELMRKEKHQKKLVPPNVHRKMQIQVNHILFRLFLLIGLSGVHLGPHLICSLHVTMPRPCSWGTERREAGNQTESFL